MRVCSCSNHGIVITVSSSAKGAWHGGVCADARNTIKIPRSTYARVHCKYAWEKIRQPFFFFGGATSLLLPSHKVKLRPRLHIQERRRGRSSPVKMNKDIFSLDLVRR